MKSPFFSALALLAKNASVKAAVFTADTSTLAEVAIVYAWFTRRSGTPFSLNGPETLRKQTQTGRPEREKIEGRGVERERARERADSSAAETRIVE